MNKPQKIINYLHNSPPLLILALGVTAVSFAAIFIRLSSAPPLIIAFYRMAFSFLFLSPVLLINRTGRRDIKSLSIQDGILIGLGGLLLSFHFATWVTSLSHTSVASSVILVTTQPVFIVLFEFVFLREKPPLPLIRGILIAIAGGVLIGYGDVQGTEFKLYGDMLALAGAITAAGYWFIGRKVRQNVNTLPYITLVYGTSALFLLILCVIRKLPFFGYSFHNVSMFLLLALVPTLIGHTSFNWALKKVKASRVGTTILGEPVGAALLAILFFGEIPPLLSGIGGIIVLAGIYFVWRKKG